MSDVEHFARFQANIDPETLEVSDMTPQHPGPSIITVTMTDETPKDASGAAHRFTYEATLLGPPPHDLAACLSAIEGGALGQRSYYRGVVVERRLRIVLEEVLRRD